MGKEVQQTGLCCDQGMGHNCLGHNYVGHNCLGHNYVGHSYIGHDYIGHSYPGHSYACVVNQGRGQDPHPAPSVQDARCGREGPI